MRARSVFFIFAVLTTFKTVTASQFVDNSVNEQLLESVWQDTRETKNMYYALNINGKSLDGDRPWHVRWDRIKDLMDWEGKRILDIGCNIGLNLIFLQKYRRAGACTGVDLPDNIRLGHGAPSWIGAKVKAVQKAFDTSFRFYQINLDARKDYEKKLGYDFDVVFLMSVYRWVREKAKLMEYVSKFPIVVYEAHPNLTRKEHIRLFEKAGFDRNFLVNPDKLASGGRDNRDFFVFYKSSYEYLLGDPKRTSY